MANEFVIAPELAKGFPHFVETWACPVTGLIIPKQPKANLAYRAGMLALADEDAEIQTDLYTACSQSLLVFVNLFCFTLRVFETNEEGVTVQAVNTHLPFVTWEIQDRHLLRVQQAIDEGTSLLTDKSRDMGATWSHLAVLTHRFLFHKSESHLILSRKEDAVDQLDGLSKNYPNGPIADPGTLMGKIDYMLARFPKWMLPRMSRKKMHLVNLDNGTRIDGESANATAGSSDRRKSIFMDEMGKMKEGESIKRSTRDVTACRLVCSTPNGPGTAFSKWRLSGQIPVFILPWWKHPEKGKNRYTRQDELGRWKIRSPWYDVEEQNRSPKELAIEVDMDHIGSGDTFFEGTLLEEHRQLFATEPLRQISVTFKKSIPDPDIIKYLLKPLELAPIFIAPKGKWRLWCHLERGRPDQTRTYTIGIDIGKGQGASNSVMSVVCNETREKIAEYADANVPPYEFARLAVAAAMWIGGRNRPLIIWENNGDPGYDFGRQLVHVYMYPNIYFDRQEGTLALKQGKRYGWRSTREKKAVGLGILRRAYAHGGIINHSDEALTEAVSYVQYEGGGIGPAEMVEESDTTRQAHGDRVIADMLCLIGASRYAIRKVEERITPERSFGHRLRKFQKQKKTRKKTPRKFDFTIGVV